MLEVGGEVRVRLGLRSVHAPQGATRRLTVYLLSRGRSCGNERMKATVVAKIACCAVRDAGETLVPTVRTRSCFCWLLRGTQSTYGLALCGHYHYLCWEQGFRDTVLPKESWFTMPCPLNPASSSLEYRI